MFCLMLLRVLLLPSGFYAEILTRVEKLLSVILNLSVLNGFLLKQVASIIYTVVTKSALLLMDFPGSGCCDQENLIEQG